MKAERVINRIQMVERTREKVFNVEMFLHRNEEQRKEIEKILDDYGCENCSFSTLFANMRVELDRQLDFYKHILNNAEVSDEFEGVL